MVLLYAAWYASRDPHAIALASFKYVIAVVAPYVALVTYVTCKDPSAIGKVVDIAEPILLLYFVWLLMYLHSQPEVATKIVEMSVQRVGYTSHEFANIPGSADKLVGNDSPQHKRLITRTIQG